MFTHLVRGYAQLSQAAAPQSATDTIDKLCDRLLNGNSLEDRRAALLGLKGLSRDWKSEVGTRALPLLLGALEEDAPNDLETAKAVVETLSLLCEVEEVDGRPVRDDSGLRNTDTFLNNPAPLHILLTLLENTHFYLRFFSLQLLGILLTNRSSVVQNFVLTAPGGCRLLVETLDDAREIIRNESLLLTIALTSSNADIQKLLAFEGAFDRLFAIVNKEGGIGGGGIVVQDCLAAIGGLLRWNVSNQNYFRETSCIPLLAPLLLFPQPTALTPSSLSTFAFQAWSEQKVINAGLVISLVRMLVGGAGTGRSGNQKALLSSGLTRCLSELALASNAPAVLKSQSLNALADILRLSPINATFFSTLLVTPLIPPIASPSRDPDSYGGGNEDSNGDPEHDHREEGAEESGEGGEGSRRNDYRWHRGVEMLAVIAMTELAVYGDGTRGRDGLRVRAAAAGLFESYVSNSNEVQLDILATMSPSPPEVEGTPDSKEPKVESAGSILLQAVRIFPTSTRTEPFDSYTPFFACLLLSHLLLHSETSKAAARKIYFLGDDNEPGGLGGDEEDRASLISIIVGNLMMAQREQAQSANAGAGPEKGLMWSRVMVGYLIVLSIWLWESPSSVKDFLSEGSNLQVLIQPITQSSGVDAAVQGLCAFLLGICYEYNREPGPITRETLYPILQSRVGPDQFVSRILRLREDNRFRSVGPNVLEMIDDDETLEELGEEDGLWFDYVFVEFLKTNYISVQRSILLDPNTSVTRRASDNSESNELLASLRSTVAFQAKDMEDLRAQIVAMEAERNAVGRENLGLREQIESLRIELTQVPPSPPLLPATVVPTFNPETEAELSELRSQIDLLKTEVQAGQLAKLEAIRLKEELDKSQGEVYELSVSKVDAEKEQEDLLVLLEELSTKSKGYKIKLRSAGVEVSDDEGSDDE